MSVELVGGPHPQDACSGGSAATVEALLLSIASGDREALVALQSRMAGLVRVNVRRVLRDASRSEAVTQEVFAAIRKDAIHFDPHRDDAETWLLTRTHQRAIDELRSHAKTELPSHAMDEPRSVDGTDHPRAAKLDRSPSALPA